MGLFAAVVSYTLPDVERDPGKLPAWVYRSLPFVGLALVAGCLVEFGATLHGFCAAVFCLALVIVTATDPERRSGKRWPRRSDTDSSATPCARQRMPRWSRKVGPTLSQPPTPTLTWSPLGKIQA